MDTKDEIRKLISAGMFRGAATLIVSGSTSRFETLRDSVAAALETARDVGTESAQVATARPAPLQPTSPLDGPAHLEIAEAELSYMSDTEPAARHAIWSILSWAKLVEARHQQETAAQEASLKTLFPRSAAIDLLKEQAAATSGPTAAEMIAELRRRYPLSADLEPHTPTGPSAAKPDPVEDALRQRPLNEEDDETYHPPSSDAEKQAMYENASDHDRAFLHALNPERYPAPVHRNGKDAWINLYEARLDPAYGVVRLQLDAEKLILWVGGEVCWRSTGERMKGLTDIDEDDAKASFEAEAQWRGGSDQERVEKAKALADIANAPMSGLSESGASAVSAHWAAELSSEAGAYPDAACKVWLWQNGDHYLVFDNEYPGRLDDGDPMTLGEPAAWGWLKASRDNSLDPLRARPLDLAEQLSEVATLEDAAGILGPQTNRELAEMVAKFRTPPGMSWQDLANDIETALGTRGDGYRGDK